MEKALQAVLALMAIMSAALLFNLFGNAAQMLLEYPRLNLLLIFALEILSILSLVAIYRVWQWQRGGIMMLFSVWVSALLVHVYYGSAIWQKVAVPVCLFLLLITVLPNRERFLTPPDNTD